MWGQDWRGEGENFINAPVTKNDYRLGKTLGDSSTNLGIPRIMSHSTRGGIMKFRW
eukprot:c28252_g1_i1 orf=87-254(-)